MIYHLPATTARRKRFPSLPPPPPPLTPFPLPPLPSAYPSCLPWLSVVKVFSSFASSLCRKIENCFFSLRTQQQQRQQQQAAVPLPTLPPPAHPLLPLYVCLPLSAPSCLLQLWHNIVAITINFIFPIFYYLALFCLPLTPLCLPLTPTLTLLTLALPLSTLTPSHAPSHSLPLVSSHFLLSLRVFHMKI